VTADARSFAVSSDLGRYGMATQARHGQFWLDSIIHYAESPDATRHKRIATQWREMVVEMLRAAGVERGRIATESAGSLLAPATPAFPQLQIVQPHSDLRNVRRIKHADENCDDASLRIAPIGQWRLSRRAASRATALRNGLRGLRPSRRRGGKRLPGENFMIRGLRSLAGSASISSDGFLASDQVLQGNDGIVSTSIATRLNGLAMELARPWLAGSPDKRITRCV
jgi:hypothetical protein